MKKLKISFEITDNWSKDDFRQLIKKLIFLQLDDICDKDIELEIYIISTNDSSFYINKVANSLEIDSNHTIICNFTQDKITAINDLDINVHFDNIYTIVELIDVETDCYPVLVDNIQDMYHVQPDYYTKFKNILANILKNEETKEC